ncbi:FAD-dependent monooxygenase [Thermopolyspora sp. NPDC052614]|uniref:NAD(P)/FAD-dependent oxidoreductase n=1 Tax=Thermopolyspora sp. NPDC052614 TaxID=3155682 RepID=UPI00341DB6F4
MPIHHRHDVVVVGARAAGAATALLLARLGHDVVLLDRAGFPSDTLSTHQLARTGVVLLRRWGLLDPVLASGAPAIRRVTLAAAGESQTRTIKDKAGVDLLVAPRRHILDTIVAEAAAGAGADLRLGTTVTGLLRDGAGRVTGVHGHDAGGSPLEIHARFVVGADGLRSRVAREAGAELIEDRGGDGAAQYTYYDGLPWDAIELIVAERAFTGVFPTHAGQACVWICTPGADARQARRRAASRTEAFTATLRRTAPELAERLTAGRRTAPVTGMLRAPKHLRRAHGPGWALVGDAGYHRDPITGHGLSDAYRDAELLAAALDQALRGDLEEDAALAGYQRRRDEAVRDIFELTCALAALPARPRVRRPAEAAQRRHRRRGGRHRRRSRPRRPPHHGRLTPAFHSTREGNR